MTVRWDAAIVQNGINMANAQKRKVCLHICVQSTSTQHLTVQLIMEEQVVQVFALSLIVLLKV